MTVRLVRNLAKELAGQFYEENKRSDRFREAFPTVKDYLRGTRHKPDGVVVKRDPGWFHFINAAKGILATSLNDKAMSVHEKEHIAEQLIENAQRGSHFNARRVLQTHIGHREVDEK